MSGEVPTLEFQQRRSRRRNSAHSQTVHCADCTFHGAHCSGALSSLSVAPEIIVKLLSCNLEGSHGGFLTSCLISAMAAGLLLLPDAAGTEGIQQVTHNLHFLLPTYGLGPGSQLWEVPWPPAPSSASFSILPYTRVQAANNNQGKCLTGPHEFGDPGLSHINMCLAAEPPPPHRTSPILSLPSPHPHLLPVPSSVLRVSFLSVAFR